MTTTDRDAQIMAEADRERKHALELARMDAETKRAQSLAARQTAESRHRLLGYVGIGVTIVVVLLGLFGAVLYGVADGRKDQQLRERQRNEVAQTCIRDGNIWINGDCIPAKKS